MKIIIKIFKVLVIVIILLILFRGWIYRNTIQYSRIGQREKIEINNLKLKTLINNEINDRKLSLEEIIEISNRITTEKLNFTFEKSFTNTNDVFLNGKANCIGYSAVFNSIGEYIISEQNYKDKYQFNHLKGKLDLFGFDIHSIFDSPFFKDHDFNEIVNKISGDKTYIDPSVNAYLKIGKITFRN